MLHLKVKSFSYKKGMPTDGPPHGGGFVFDCRAIHNPGREEKYKVLCGKDEPVQVFLDALPEYKEFMSHVNGIVEASIEKYIARGFESLSVSFGCTGGQHRSVYSAELLAKKFADHPHVEVYLEHRDIPDQFKI